MADTVKEMTNEDRVTATGPKPVISSKNAKNSGARKFWNAVIDWYSYCDQSLAGDEYYAAAVDLDTMMWW